VSVPDNWEPLQNGNNGVVIAPDGGYYQSGNNRTSFSHGLELGVIANERHSLKEGTDELVQSFSQNNPDLRMQGSYRRENIGGRSGLTAYFSNRSENNDDEVVVLSTVELRDGSMLYIIGVAPEAEYNLYERPFQRARQSLVINDQRNTRF
jgi:hypothetical protein